MTLIEMMIVLVIIALVMTGMAYGLGSLTRQRLKSSAMAVASAVRLSYSRAATTGKTVRIVFDLDGRSFWAEEAESGRVLLDPEDEEDLDEEDDEDEPNNSLSATSQAESLAGLLGTDASTLLSAARGAAESDLSGQLDFDMLGELSSMGQSAAAKVGETPRYRAPRFAPVEGKMGRPRTLGKGVEFVSVVTTHREEPATEGKAALYFFPGGLTELAVIQLRDSGGYINSVEVRPLTGRCIIHDGPYEPPMDEEDQNEAGEAF